MAPAATAHEAPKSSSAMSVALFSPEEVMGAPLDRILTRRIEDLVMADTLEAELSDDLTPGAAQAARIAYAQRLFRPIWTEQGALSLARLGATLFQYGLRPDRVLDHQLETLVRRRFAEDAPEQNAAADLQLTAAWLRIAAALSSGLGDEGEADNTRRHHPAVSALSASLIEAGAGGAIDAIEPFEPDHPQYRGLKRSLRHYREILDRGGWFAIPSGPMLRAGDEDDRVPALRARLRAEGFLEPDPAVQVRGDRDALGSPEIKDNTVLVGEIQGSDSQSADSQSTDSQAAQKLAAQTNQGSEVVSRRLYDEQLAAALESFQEYHGLEADGVLGPNTLDALNESVASKIDRIADSLNRWRRQGEMGNRHVWANIPSFTAEGWNDGNREIRMKTIVGKPSRATPIFSDEIEYTVANPRWFVPVSIARRDKLSKLAADPSYATRKGFRVYERSTGLMVDPWSVDWTDPAAARTYRLVQQPGQSNALGQLKIIFPNQYSVYLHGTPSVSLFDRANRAFSSGCVRLEDPVGMATWLAAHDQRTTTQRIERALASGENRHIRFGEQVPVHITYITVTVDDHGRPFFWRDVYDRHDGTEYAEEYAPLDAEPAPMSLATFEMSKN